MGWEPAKVTKYLYEDGQLVRAVTVSEPEWADGERAAMLAHLESERVLRGPHGHPMDETLSPDANPANSDAKYRYVVSGPSRDYAAQALADAQDKYSKQFPNADMGSLMWRVVKQAL